MKNTKKVLRLGIFIATGLVLFTIAIYLIGNKGSLFSPTTEVFSSFKDIRGLGVGSNVRFAGINVGTVKNINITSDTTVIVSMSIRSSYTKYIYKNSTVQIGQEGLMGGKIVLISPGNSQTGKVEEGDYLGAADGMDIEGMIIKAKSIIEEVGTVVESVNSIVGKLNDGDGDIARLINRNDLTTNLANTTQQLNASITNINEITPKVNSGQGDLGKLVNSDSLTTQMKSIMKNLNATSAKADSAIGEIHRTVHAINHGEGVLPRLIHDKKLGESVDTALVKVDDGVTQVSRAAQSIADSWILNIFSGNKDKKKKEQQADSIAAGKRRKP